MAVRTKGSLCRFAVRDEATYGTFSSTNISRYAGTLTGLDTTADLTREDDPGECTYVRAGSCITGGAYGYKASFRHPAGAGWTKWLEMAVGSLTGIGTVRDITPFTTRIRAAADEVLAWCGCKVDTLEIASSAPGSLLAFSATVKAQYLCAPSASNSFVAADGTAFAMEPIDRPAGAAITDGSLLYYSTDAGTTWTSCDAKTWTLTVSRSLESDPAVIGGHSLDAGLGLIPQTCDLSLAFTQLSRSPTWDTLKLAGTEDLQFKKVVDGYTVLLTGCTLDAGDLPSRTQSTYDETVNVTASDITVTAV
ncbi:MAG: hypothetical protein PHF83_02545 [Candidatus Methanomethylophilus sp.]|nr:hypothetical protein [Methanomethylophilus sp.]